MTSNARNSYVTLLHKAVDDNNYKEATRLINLGENVNAMCLYYLKKYKININCTALHLAVISKRNKKIVELLLKNNADINIEAHYPDTDDDHNCPVMRNHHFNRTPLLLAITEENKEIVELLIKYNVDVNLKTSIGESALSLALEGNEKKLIEILLAAGADIDLRSQNLFLLHRAVANNNYAIAEYVINHDSSDLNTVWYYPSWSFLRTCGSPLHIAVNDRNKEMVEFLLRNNADVNIKTNCDITTPCDRQGGEYYDRTPLQIAIEKEDKTIVKILIQHKAEVNLPITIQKTPLGIAIHKKNIDLMELLIHADAHVKSI
ncbi:Similar to RF_0381: Putative ankyrin repeat protein RF_0381 (Rickettsia felis (strain ATCC VR-1525 / URRWXCal2)) [Cotesia congregata]|uniref:Similar to RF_0381: Putative ankyrin repeat protein RF_0381 (Rickettsia felis (Strain ATCC VR-1525 / URRWXCal2)) n=1 Tax=Cotesia congregata TaxID=51543 RepID=A0A8J2HFM3_COTCN|nr:Similar to RF_0381: Putative ankyrin repeat protein RF_0381 (Rickettsia felis (strain ATCC VR-1525 / URRWXCal2)) [Cotesia congregata]